MTDFLVEHARDNVWCAPRQDVQSIVQPARISPPSGVWNTIVVHGRTYKLPVQGVRFHVYQVGQLHPTLMGLFPIEFTWVSMSAVCNKQKMIVDLYADSGVQLPRFETWYIVGPDKVLLIATMEQLKIPVKLEFEKLYMRVYTNAWFNSMRDDPNAHVLKVEGNRPLSTQAVLDLQHHYEETLLLPGHTYSFVNGFKVSKIDLFTVQVGDVVEFVYDGSIKHVIDFSVSTLRFFTSLLDQKQKYLLHYQGIGDSTIDYHDDIDFFLLEHMSQDRMKGVYIHRNQADSVRMVTHKDYSLSVQHVVALADAQPEWDNEQKLTVRMHVRHGGWDRALVFENNRIMELYKLQDNDLREAMLGIHSNVPNWRADVLENAAYVKIMRSEYNDITKPVVEEAYGYNAISKLIGDTPQQFFMSSGQKVVNVPWGLRSMATSYEYDAAGKLLDSHIHVAGGVYGARDDKAVIAELISGEADDLLDEVYGEKYVTLDLKYSHRMYTCPIVNGVPNNVWTDVTGTGAYGLLGDKLTWLVDTTKFYTNVRSDRNILSYKLKLGAPDGLLKFSLTHRAYRGGVIGTYVMQIPMGELDIWMNGYSLIENLDYYVNFPEIVIVNKTHLQDILNKKQDIVVRFTGFCKKDFSREECIDFGFVKQGLLSRNNRFDIRDDKVLRMTVDGALKDRKDLKFSEENSGVGVAGSRNGAPYLIRDIVVPMRSHTIQDTYDMRAKSIVIDKAVSDYLTAKLPEPPMAGPNPIQYRYPLVSPFACSLMYDLIAGHLNDPRIYQQYNDMVVLEICKPYERLLLSDPTQDVKKTDWDYVIAHPHNLNFVVDMDIYHYRFLSRAVGIYLNGKVSLSHFIAIKAD